jgi:glycerate kinase
LLIDAMPPFSMQRPLRVLVAPDSFKGSLPSHEVARRIAAGIERALPGSVVTQAPIADGGEGTGQTVALKLGGEWHATPVTDANGRPVDLPFAVCSSAALASFAIFDVAEIVGLPAASIPVGQRTSKGVGQAVRAIAALGHKTIVLGLGGSSTNDGGAGMLCELAVTALDASRAGVDPVLDTLEDVVTLVQRDDAAWLADVTLIGLTDVTSPLTGPAGASHVFGAQKGVEDRQASDGLLERFATQLSALTGEDHSGVAGAGAAGGLGFAVRSMGGILQPGAEFILQALGLTASTMSFDWVITGEGRSDGQTLLGKGPFTVARLARANQIPVSLLSGAVDADAALLEAFDGCFSVQSAPVTLAYAIEHAGELVEAAAFNLAALFEASRRLAIA